MMIFRPVLIAALAATIGLCGCQVPPGASGMHAQGANVPLAKDPRSSELYLSLIAQLNSDGKFYAALAHIDEFERLYGKTPQAAMLRGNAFIGLGDLANAQTAYSAIPDNALPGDKQYGLGRVAAARGDWKQASDYLQQAVAQQPTNVQFLGDLGCALYQLGRKDDALFALHKAHELAPSDAKVSSSLAMVLAGTAKTDKAADATPTVQQSSASEVKPASIALASDDRRDAPP